jgi:hypothetical protein
MLDDQPFSAPVSGTVWKQVLDGSLREAFGLQVVFLERLLISLPGGETFGRFCENLSDFRIRICERA